MVNQKRRWFKIVDFEETDEPDRIGEDIDILLKDRPDELKKLQENRTFERNFKAEPIDDDNKTVKALGKNVNLNAVLKQNIDKRSVFTIDNLCDMFVSWRIEQLQKYQKKKRVVEFKWLWLFILIACGVVGVILIIAILLPNLGNIGGNMGGVI